LILALRVLDIIGVICIKIKTWRRFVMKKNEERIKKIEVKGWLPKGRNVKSFYSNLLLFILPTLFILLLSTPLAINAQSGFGWGDNIYGQLGDGINTDSNVPVQVLNLSGITAIAGGGDHSLALKQDGTVWAWGWNGYGQLGNGTTFDGNLPVPVSGLTGIAAIAAGSGHSFALKNDGTVWAWGYNGDGELGNGTNTNSNVPVQVSNLSEITAMAGGGYHSLALKQDGSVWAWGYNSLGQLGNGTYSNSNIPVQVLNLSGITAIAGGGDHSLALKNDGTVWAWGWNASGQLGNGTNTDSNVPVQVSGLTGITAIAGGGDHSLALKQDGTVWAWGYNGEGELGNGTNTNSNVPVQVLNLSGITAIAGGDWHSLALKQDGTVWAWGYNGSGQLGNGTNTSSNVPVQILNLSGIIGIAGGYWHSLAILGSGCPTITLSPSSLPSGTVGTAYNETITASGGSAPYTFTKSSGTLPSGLTLSAGGVLSGTPTTAGTYNFTVTATDSNNCTGSSDYSITINSGGCSTITLSPSTLPSGTVGTTYNETISASGGTSPYTYSVASGALPSGLTLSNSGVLSGTPTTAGTYNFTVTAADSNNCTGSRAYSITINCPTITLSPSTLPSGTVGTAYSQKITANGGTAPYTFTKSSGTLPSGLTLSAGGVLSGTPTTAGTYNFTVTATDSSNCTGSSDYSITINSGGCPTITLSPSTLPSGTAGTAYSQTITASGGTSPYTFAITSGSLPAGLTLSATGTLSGTPTTAGSYNFTVTATDKNSCQAYITYTLLINPAGCPAITLSPTTLANGIVGTAYSQTITASGGSAPYTYVITNGSLPPGFTLSSNGVLSGTPTTVGTYSFTITATDSNNCTGSRGYSIEIIAPPCSITCSASVPLSGQIGTPVNLTADAVLTNCNGTPSYLWDFGDGNTSTEQNPNHIYSSAGNFNWTMTVSADSAQCIKHGSISIVTPPTISNIVKMGNPFRLKIYGSNFNTDIAVYIGADTTPWANVAYKNSGLIVLKGGAALKAKFPKGVPVEIKIVNGDGGSAIYHYTR
jgi:alpha-tubulin suppressor-like RCC1 family protein